jgi:large subunit ribosomal protein L3
VTTQNVELLEVRKDDNLLLVAGSVPGPNGGLVLVRNAVKAKVVDQ